MNKYYSITCNFISFVLDLADSELVAEKDQSGKPLISSLPEHSRLMCSSASTLMQLFFKNCSTGDITFEEIKMIKKKKDQVGRLFAAGCNGYPDNTKKFCFLIEERIKQADYFRIQKSILVSLCKQLSIKQLIVEGKHIYYYFILFCNTLNILLHLLLLYHI